MAIQVTGVVDAVANELRAAVFDGELAPGSLVTEAWAAERFEVARSSAKAAIEKLVAEGLLQRTPHRSARVRPLDEASVRDIYRTRRRIEAEALRELAAERRVPSAAREANDEIARHLGGSSIDIVDPDMRFHTEMVDAIGSERTSRAYHALVAEVRMCMAQVQGRRLIPVDQILDEHRRIVELVAAGDGEGAVALLAEHLGRAEERLAAAIS
ncbi:GntR family transcriptional regulator [Homoserinibacter sp. GY 40078]|uniref:GntR family transcriptional regulator n=1 Tax=Homoserinibacter sp. GY 40078 TaxID=2603275 RepID=UPI0011CC3EAE|nr:GntR family transcriptional regulator [Homoserinibacter sp. GY 40078]TXK18680.1 GntR family transcriptional regulator [Homoserinibacter sp. GY 40078]